MHQCIYTNFFGGGNSAAPPEFWQLKAVVNALQMQSICGPTALSLSICRERSGGGGREQRDGVVVGEREEEDKGWDVCWYLNPERI
jgi:hypothetical protein